jgi:hypothetical protein
MLGLLVRGQLTMLRLFDGRQPVRKQLGKPLIPGITIFFNRLSEPQVGLFQQFEIMGAAFAAHDDQNLETEQADDQLGFDGVPFFFRNTSRLDAASGVPAAVPSHRR